MERRCVIDFQSSGNQPKVTFFRQSQRMNKSLIDHTFLNEKKCSSFVGFLSPSEPIRVQSFQLKSTTVLSKQGTTRPLIGDHQTKNNTFRFDKKCKKKDGPRLDVQSQVINQKPHNPTE